MKRSISLWQFLGFGVTALGGTLLHFLYEWLGKSPWIAPFSGVNESTWEHMKLLFWPMLAFAAAQSLFFGERKSFWCVKLRGILLGLLLIPVLFYTYNGAIGKSPDWINIAIFFVSTALAFLHLSHLLIRPPAAALSPVLPLTALALLALAFVLFTFLPPPLALFRDPLTGAFGIPS